MGKSFVFHYDKKKKVTELKKKFYKNLLHKGSVESFWERFCGLILKPLSTGLTSFSLSI